MSEIEKIINKIGDLRSLWQLVANSSDELNPVLNCFDRLLYDIQKDVDDLAAKL